AVYAVGRDTGVATDDPGAACRAGRAAAGARSAVAGGGAAARTGHGPTRPRPFARPGRRSVADPRHLEEGSVPQEEAAGVSHRVVNPLTPTRAVGADLRRPGEEGRDRHVPHGVKS